MYPNAPGSTIHSEPGLSPTLIGPTHDLQFLLTLCRLSTMTEPRISTQTLKVLGALLSQPQDELSGADIARTTKLASGTLYPILIRLEDAGWVASRWEKRDPHELGRPRRRFYRVTAVGAKRAKQAVKELRPLFGDLAWA